MKSIKDIYRIGKGPSSSHTMGPERAAIIFENSFPEADSFRVRLYGSLAKTGKGHGTDRVIRDTLAPKSVEIEFVTNAAFTLPHANTMDIAADKLGKEIGRARVLSIGGGEIEIEGVERENEPHI